MKFVTSMLIIFNFAGCNLVGLKLETTLPKTCGVWMTSTLVILLRMGNGER